MSYDLYLRPRSGELDEAQFLEYFRARPNYGDEGYGWYANEDTGVYFGFEWNAAIEADDELDYEADDEDDEEDPAAIHPVTFNINFFRPSCFILEAEPEVTAFVRHFDLVVFDPQDDMGDGEYRPEKLVTGWNRGNALAFSAVLQEPDRIGDITSLPSERLLEVWRWNRDRQALQDALGESKFVPRIMFIRVGDELHTAAVWPDGLASVLPRVDRLIIPRENLATRPLRSEEDIDIATAAWSDVQDLLLRHGSYDEAGRLTLGYDAPPSEVVRFVQALPADDGGFTGLPADEVLDRELVEKYASR